MNHNLYRRCAIKNTAINFTPTNVPVSSRYQDTGHWTLDRALMAINQPRRANAPKAPLYQTPPAGAAHHVEELWTLDADEVDAGLIGHGLGQQRLPAAGRTAEQDPGR